MLCREPYVQGGAAYGCGQCLPCRMNRRRLWTHRIMLEAMKWSENAFVTLTYSEEKVPKLSGGASTLRSSDLQSWLKRLRRAIEPARIRFFAVGEYGEETSRPHYHVALFGFTGCVHGDSRLAVKGGCSCASCVLVARTWGNGMCHLGTLERKSAQYVSGYVVKKMTRKDDPRLKGREPEFARMSLRPGIGALAMEDVAAVVKEHRLIDLEGDVPANLRHGAYEMPLGRYLRRKLRVACGLSEEAPAITLERAQAKLQDVRNAAAVATDAEVHGPLMNEKLFRALLVELGAVKVLQMETRLKMKGRKHEAL